MATRSGRASVPKLCFTLLPFFFFSTGYWCDKERCMYALTVAVGISQSSHGSPSKAYHSKNHNHFLRLGGSATNPVFVINSTLERSYCSMLRTTCQPNLVDIELRQQCAPSLSKLSNLWSSSLFGWFWCCFDRFRGRARFWLWKRRLL